MRFTVRQRRFIARLAGYATNPVARRVRSLLKREQRHRIGSYDAVLPPDHNLPFYQRRDPTYDAYAIATIADLAQGVNRLLVVDLGANVGDTALAMLSAGPNVDVVCVEGDPYFVSYLRRNLAGQARARIVAGFVGPVGSSDTFSRQGSTGGFQAGGEGDPVTRWVTPADLLSDARDYDLVVWKSDIDGFDIHVLVEHWDVIDPACDVLWFEFDSPGTLGDRDDVGRLARLLRRRRVSVYDNLGRRMLGIGPGPDVATVLLDLGAWTEAQRDGFVTVPYLDVWAVRADRPPR